MMTRQEAIEELKEDIELYMPSDPILLDRELPDGRLITALEMAIKALEQEPKTGHWKRISIDKYVQHAMAYYKCSECGKDIIGEHNYCPNCGAKMVEPQESEG